MSLEKVYGSQTFNLISTSKILVVGAGGIGCELLKTLVSSGFKNITTIDLDTIEVSNLNRQFLFRKKHIKQSKSKIASSVVSSFYPLSKITGYLGNIKSDEFDSEFFKKFDIILNALDNTEARRHVNRICLSLNLSFIESGTQGFIGQVIPIIPKVTQCWECTPKEANTKTYPICTIRATPDKPVHCIVWSKQIFELLFGVGGDGNDFKDLMGNISRGHKQSDKDFAVKVFNYLFKGEIEYQMSMDDLKEKFEKMKNLPRKIEYYNIENNKNTKIINNNEYSKTSILSMEDNGKLFIYSFLKLIKRGDYGKMVFDKDDNLQMMFISCAANLRMYCYHINMQSEFNNKGIAGNIIHAIATTNAIVAGVMVIQCIHLLKRNKLNINNDCNEKKIDDNIQSLKTRSSWVNSKGPRFLYAQSCDTPNKQCLICQHAIKHLIINPSMFTFGDFITKILQKHMGFKQPDLTISHPTWKESETNIIECILEDDDDDDKQYKLLQYKKQLNDKSIKILNNGKIIIEDFSQDVKCHLVVHYLNLDKNIYVNGFEIQNEFDIGKFKVSKNVKNRTKMVDVPVVGQKRKNMEVDSGVIGNPNGKKKKN